MILTDRKYAGKGQLAPFLSETPMRFSHNAIVNLRRRLRRSHEMFFEYLGNYKS